MAILLGREQMDHTQNINKNSSKPIEVMSVTVDKESWGLFSADHPLFPQVWRQWVEVAWVLMDMIGAVPEEALVRSQQGKTVWKLARQLEERRVFVSVPFCLSPPILERGRLKTPRIDDNAWARARDLYLYEEGLGLRNPLSSPSAESVILAMSVCPPERVWCECVAQATREDPQSGDEYCAFVLGTLLPSPAGVECRWEIFTTLTGWQHLVGKAMFNFPFWDGEITVDSPSEKYYAILCAVGDDNLPIKVWVTVPKALPRPEDNWRSLFRRLGIFENENVRQMVQLSLSLSLSLCR